MQARATQCALRRTARATQGGEDASPHAPSRMCHRHSEAMTLPASQAVGRSPNLSLRFFVKSIKSKVKSFVLKSFGLSLGSGDPY